MKTQSTAGPPLDDDNVNDDNVNDDNVNDDSVNDDNVNDDNVNDDNVNDDATDTEHCGKGAGRCARRRAGGAGPGLLASPSPVHGGQTRGPRLPQRASPLLLHGGPVLVLAKGGLPSSSSSSSSSSLSLSL